MFLEHLTYCMTIFVSIGLNVSHTSPLCTQLWVASSVKRYLQIYGWCHDGFSILDAVWHEIVEVKHDTSFKVLRNGLIIFRILNLLHGQLNVQANYVCLQKVNTIMTASSTPMWMSLAELRWIFLHAHGSQDTTWAHVATTACWI